MTPDLIRGKTRIEGWSFDTPFSAGSMATQDERVRLVPTPFPLDHLALRGAPEVEALVAGEERLTYRELDEAVGRTAAALVAHGIKPGDRVATWMGKTRLACITPLAAARAGLVHVPINPVLKHSQAAHILADSGAKLLIANSARLESLEQGDLADAKPVALEEWEEGADALPISSRDPAELAALLYTSGSTGRPKGVEVQRRSIENFTDWAIREMGLSAADRVLQFCSIGFDVSILEFLPTLASGATAFATDKVQFATCQFLARLFLTAEYSLAIIVVGEEFPARLRGRAGHFFKADLLASQFTTLEEPTPAEGAIVVDVDAELEVVVDRVLAALRSSGSVAGNAG